MARNSNTNNAGKQNTASVASYEEANDRQARQLRLALAQIDVAVGDLHGNCQRILDAARQAHRAGVSVVAFPELALPGYPPEDLLLKPGFVADNLRALDQLAQASADLRDLTLVVGFVDRQTDIYNAAALLRNGERAGVYHKQYLPNYGVFDEDRYFSAGTETPVFVLDGVAVGVTICEDIWYPGGAHAQQAAAGAEVLLNISASPFYAGKQGARERMLATRAADSAAIVAYLNLVGGQDELIFDGSSVVFDAQGELIARAQAFAEDLLIVTLDIEDVFRTRLHNPLRRKDQGTQRLEREGAAAPIVISLTRDPTPASVAPPDKKLAVSVESAKTPALGAPGRIEPQPSRVEEVYRALTLGVGDYVRKNGFQSAIISLSGGIDSALTATIAVDALGADRVTGVSLPSRYSSEGSRDDARALADNLGIRFLTIPIEGMFVAGVEALREPLASFPPTTSTLTEENLQARIRGNLMMALSNQTGALLLTTGNKSEMAVGYATLYGDMAGGFAVIRDVPKTLVYAVSRARNRRGSRPVIPEAILDKPPSAELRPGQLDADSLPPYEVLDPILEEYVERDSSVEDIVAKGFDEATVRRVVAMVDGAEYKRRQAPPGARVTSRAFGKDRRMPITDGSRNGARR